MSACEECSDVLGKAFKVQCVTCAKWYHKKCINNYNRFTEWNCQKCVTNKNTPKSCPDEKTTPSLENIFSLLQELTAEVRRMKEEQKARETDLGNSLELCHKKLDDNALLIANQQKDLIECVDKIEKLTQENINLKEKVRVLGNRLGDAEQYSRRNTIEIQGVPDIPNESVQDTVRKIGQALDIEINPEMIDACHRLPKTPNQTHRTIIAKFVRRTDKDHFMERRRVKRNLSTRHANLPGDNTVYVNESLSPERRKLLAQARVIRREKNYAFIWVRQGIIKLRKNQGSDAIIINSEEDLAKL